MFATGRYIKDLAKAGVEIFSYMGSLADAEELHGQDALHVPIQRRRGGTGRFDEAAA
jgi:hypothetical protein